jgi:hypothetical protein
MTGLVSVYLQLRLPQSNEPAAQGGMSASWHLVEKLGHRLHGFCKLGASITAKPVTGNAEDTNGPAAVSNPSRIRIAHFAQARRRSSSTLPVRAASHRARGLGLD